MKRKTNFGLILTIALLFVFYSCRHDQQDTLPQLSKEALPQADSSNAGLILPSGFYALKVADNIGEARHIAVNTNGDIFVKLNALKNGKGIIRLKDTTRDGRADIIEGYGDFAGSGIEIKNGFLYASSNTDVYRFPLDRAGDFTEPQPQRIVTGLLARSEHEAKAFTLDNDGNIYVNVGAYSNSCQVKDRTPGSPGMQPCPILDSAGGIWQFKADQLNQQYGNGVRFATGLRNVMGLDWNTQANTLIVMQHGRDQLSYLFPKIYNDKQSADLPAECMYILHKGDDAGWPYIYYDQFQNKKILSPEYGGDGNQTGGENAIDPAATFPAHMAPNDLLFYTGSMFPERYKNGAFIAFHGSWNRAPEPQKGYFVAFLPFQDGKPNGQWEVFADNFAGGPQYMQPSKAKHRPCGLAQGPDGSLYVSDDKGGTIYRIVYKAK